VKNHKFQKQVKIGQKHRAIYMKTCVLYVITGDIKLPYTLCERATMLRYMHSAYPVTN